MLLACYSMQEEQYSAVPTQQPRATPQLGSGLLREMFFLVNLEFFAPFLLNLPLFSAFVCFWAASRFLSRFIFLLLCFFVFASLLFCFSVFLVSLLFRVSAVLLL